MLALSDTHLEASTSRSLLVAPVMYMGLYDAA